VKEQFVEQFVRFPSQIIHGGRQLVVGLLNWSESLLVFNRWLRFALE
jgi:hypothetical protein